jgi:hypothetical protein
LSSCNSINEDLKIAKREMKIMGKKIMTTLSQPLPPPQLFDIKKVIVHENWKPRRFEDGNDIALVRLAKPVVLFYVSGSVFEVIGYRVCH